MTPYTYSVHPSQLRRAMAMLSAQGIDIDGYGRGPDGMMIIVVNLPDGAHAPDWQRRPGRTNWHAILRTAAVLLACAAVAYVAYTLINRDAGSTVDSVVTTVTAPVTRPLEQARDTADSVTNMADAITESLNMALRVLGIAVVGVVLWFVRKPLAGIVGVLAGLWRRSHG